VCLGTSCDGSGAGAWTVRPAPRHLRPRAPRRSAAPGGLGAGARGRRPLPWSDRGARRAGARLTARNAPRSRDRNRDRDVSTARPSRRSTRDGRHRRRGAWPCRPGRHRAVAAPRRSVARRSRRVDARAGSGLRHPRPTDASPERSAVRPRGPERPDPAACSRRLAAGGRAGARRPEQARERRVVQPGRAVDTGRTRAEASRPTSSARWPWAVQRPGPRPPTSRRSTTGRQGPNAASPASPHPRSVAAPERRVRASGVAAPASCAGHAGVTLAAPKRSGYSLRQRRRHVARAPPPSLAPRCRSTASRAQSPERLGRARGAGSVDARPPRRSAAEGTSRAPGRGPCARTSPPATTYEAAPKRGSDACRPRAPGPVGRTGAPTAVDDTQRRVARAADGRRRSARPCPGPTSPDVDPTHRSAAGLTAPTGSGPWRQSEDTRLARRPRRSATTGSRAPCACRPDDPDRARERRVEPLGARRSPSAMGSHRTGRDAGAPKPRRGRPETHWASRGSGSAAPRCRSTGETSGPERPGARGARDAGVTSRRAQAGARAASAGCEASPPAFRPREHGTGLACDGSAAGARGARAAPTQGRRIHGARRLRRSWTGSSGPAASRDGPGASPVPAAPVVRAPLERPQAERLSARVGRSRELSFPFSASGQREPPGGGVASPASLRPQVSSTSRRVAPSLAAPGLFHPGGARGVSSLQRFSPAGRRTPLGWPCPS
jgi:hypothetical protein